MNYFNIHRNYGALFSVLVLALVAVLSNGVFAQAEGTKVSALLVNKSASEKANIKGQEVARIVQKGIYNRSGVQIEIVDIQAIDGGVQVFARAWKNGKQIGFGADGTVDMERFRIFNPPVLVDDAGGDIVREWEQEGPDGTKVHKQRKLREDPQEALFQVIEHDLSVMRNVHTDERIIKGKRGNTTSTYFSSTDDGTFPNDAKNPYSVARNASSSGAIEQSNGNPIHNSYIAGSDYYVRRFVTYFDTNTIPDGDTVTSATYSLATLSGGDAPQTADSDSIAVVGFSGSNPPVVSDFDDFGSTSFGTKTIASWSSSNGVYNNISLNSTGMAAISKTGITPLGARTLNDLNNVTPTGRNQIPAYQADETGTSKDPSLVVEHSETPAAPTAPTNLETESQSNPTSLSTPTPRFSALYNDPNTTDTAVFYQIQVATTTDFTSSYWDSTKTAMASTSKGSRSPDITYAGTALASSTTYYWRIKFWDTGGLESDWSTATSSFSLSTAALEVLSIRKSANESVINSATLQPDNELSFAVTSGKTYFVEGVLFASSTSGTPDLKIAFTAPNGSVLDIGYVSATGGQNDGGVLEASGAGSIRIQLPADTPMPVMIKGTFVAGGNGAFALQWAQFAGNASAVVVNQGSAIKIEEI